MDEFEELGDEFPDIHSLFLYYNDLYFGGVLLSNTTVAWSSGRMTSCGGICKYHPQAGCEIRLSEPLLKLRPVRDLKMVLLHEMIHAHNMTLKIYDPDPGGHGPPFRALMDKINKSTVPDPQRPPGGYNITTTHSMHDEVNNYRNHHWECDRCKKLIRRSMNRPPQEADCFGIRTRGPTGAACRDPNCAYHVHIRTCGGSYVKIKEPEKPPKAQKQSASASAGSAGAAGSRAANKTKASSVPPSLPPGQRSIDSLLGVKRPAANSASPESLGSPLSRVTAAGGGAAAAISTAAGVGAAGGKGQVSSSGAGSSGAGAAARGGGTAGPLTSSRVGNNSGGSMPGAAAAAAGGREAGSRPGSVPGSSAPAGRAGAAAAGAPPLPPDAPEPAPVSAEELRRRCAEAALARFGGGRGGGSGSAARHGSRPVLQDAQGSAAGDARAGRGADMRAAVAAAAGASDVSLLITAADMGGSKVRGLDDGGSSRAASNCTGAGGPGAGPPTAAAAAAVQAGAGVHACVLAAASGRAAPLVGVPESKAVLPPPPPPLGQAPPWPPDDDVLLVEDSDAEADGVVLGQRQEAQRGQAGAAGHARLQVGAGRHGGLPGVGVGAAYQSGRGGGGGGGSGSGGGGHGGGTGAAGVGAEVIDLVDSDED